MKPAVLCLLAAPLATAHFQPVNAAVTGPEYATRDRALVATKIDRSQSVNYVATCENPYMWISFQKPENFNTLMVGGTVPVIERFEDVRVAVAVIGPDLPLDGLQQVPQAIRDQVPVGMGVHAVPAVPDQSSCSSFTEDPLSTGELRGGPQFAPYNPSMGSPGDAPFTGYHNWPGPRCFFHEEWGGSDMWIVQDELVPLQTGGTGQHYIVFWAPSDQLLGPPLHTAKWGAVFGDVGQSEEFSGTTLDAGECALPSMDFYENECKNGFGDHPEVHEGPDFGRRELSVTSRRLSHTTRKLSHNWPECEPFYGVPIPNRYECASAPAVVTNCNSICHNHGKSCRAGGSVCGTVAEATDCAETCSWQACGTDGITKAAEFARGKAGIGCPDHCTANQSAPVLSTCDDIKVAYKYSKCCADSDDKVASLPLGSCPRTGITEGATTCLELKNSYRQAECCSGTPNKEASLPAGSCPSADSTGCPAECLGDFSQHHDDDGADHGSEGGCTEAACLAANPPGFCSFIPGCASGGAQPSPSPVP